MKKLCLILVCALGLGVFEPGIMAVDQQKSNISMRLQREYDQFKQAIKCFLEKGLIGCDRAQKKRLLAASIALAILVVAVIGGGTFIGWKVHKRGAVPGKSKEEKDAEDATGLFAAIEQGDVELVKRLMRKNIKLVKLQDKDGNTPLHKAVQLGNQDIVKLLIEGDVGLAKRWIMEKAEEKGSEEVAMFFMGNKSDVNKKNKLGATPLHLAVQQGNEDIVKFLIKRGAKEDVKDKDGNIPLHWAAEKDNIDVAKLLISNFVDMFKQNKYGHTPLHRAVVNNNKEMAQFLIDSGASIHEQDKDGNTPLHWASGIDDIDMVKLLARPGNVNMKNNQGWAPLHMAAQNNNQEVGEILIMNYADVNAKDNDGNTPLHWAVEKNNQEMAKFLIEKDADVNLRNNLDVSPKDLSNFQDLEK